MWHRAVPASQDNEPQEKAIDQNAVTETVKPAQAPTTMHPKSSPQAQDDKKSGLSQWFKSWFGQ